MWLKTGIMSAALAWSFASGTAAKAQAVRVDGSSTVFPITEAVAEEFGKRNRAVRVTVGVSGTGGGFKKFVVGETDISNASRPIKASEAALAKRNGIQFIELPVAMDALTVVVHPANTWATSLTRAELNKIWEPGSRVRSWAQVRAGFPNRPLKLYGAGTDSGTFDYFTEAINGKEKASRSDYTASEDDNTLVQGVSRDPGALGYFGYAYYEENSSRLKAVAINNGRGAIRPSPASVNNGTYQPLARPLFIYVNKASLNKPAVASFVRFYVANMGKLSKQVGYVPLPRSIQNLTAQRLAKRKTGTIFGNKGAVIGVTVGDLLRREAAGR
jgi:phosphate transport system substrate-binding protein